MTDDAAPQHRRTRARRSKRRIRRVVFLVVVAAMLGGAAAYVSNRDAAEVPAAEAPPPAADHESLLVAIARVDDDSRQADSLTLFDVTEGDAGRPVMMQIPAETLAFVPRHGFARLARALSVGGAALQKTAVEGRFGIGIDRSIEVDDVTLARVIAALGGIDVDVTERVLERGADGREELVFPLGPRRLGGIDAVEYMTYRAPTDPDTARFGRARKAWLAILDAARDQERARAAATEARAAMPDPESGAALAFLFERVAAAGEPEVVDLPGRHEEAGFRVDEGVAAGLLRRRFAPAPAAEQAPGGARVSLAYAPGEADAADAVAEKLAAAGLLIVDMAETAQAGVPARIVVYGDDERARKLGPAVRDLVGSGAVETAPIGTSEVNVMVVIGTETGKG